MDSINDIEPIVENSFGYIFYILYAAILIVFLIAIIWFIKRTKKREENPFDSLDFTKADRDLIYKFTIIAKEQGVNSKLEALLKELEPYKYSKEEKEIDSKIINKIKEYIKEVQGVKK